MTNWLDEALAESSLEDAACMMSPFYAAQPNLSWKLGPNSLGSLRIDSAHSSGLNYKHIMILNYNSSVVNKLGASLTDDARVIIYDRHMFIV